jgi:hypothetical protein
MATAVTVSAREMTTLAAMTETTAVAATHVTTTAEVGSGRRQRERS